MTPNAFHNMKRYLTMRKAQRELVYVALQNFWHIVQRKKLLGYAPIGGRGEWGAEMGTHPHKILFSDFSTLVNAFLVDTSVLLVVNLFATYCKPRCHQ